MRERVIAVVGATGLQGRAVTAHLLSDGWAVRALTRDTAGPAARMLAAAGAQIVRAEMDEPASLAAAFADAHGVFSVQPTVGSPGTASGFGAADEVRWGSAVADAAHEAGVAHVVYSSVCGAHRHEAEALPQNLVSKWRIEQHIARLGLPATVLRPVSFMENYTGGYVLRDGGLMTALAPDVAQQVVAVADVAAVAAAAFERPQEWIGRAVELVGDERTPVQVADAIADAIGRPLPYVRIPIETLRQVNEEFAVAHEWLNERGYRADLAATRRAHSGMQDLDTWLRTTGAAQIRAFLAAQPA